MNNNNSALHLHSSWHLASLFLCTFVCAAGTVVHYGFTPGRLFSDLGSYNLCAQNTRSLPGSTCFNARHIEIRHNLNVLKTKDHTFNEAESSRLKRHGICYYSYHHLY